MNFKNKDIERWIFDWQLKNPGFDSATLSRIHLAMLDLMRDPIGVGRDQFYIDGGFIGKVNQWKLYSISRHK